MTLRAYTLDDLARDHGRSRDWASGHWRGLVAAKRLPPPLVESGAPTWDAAQVYAIRDKHLPAAVRATAAAIRAAYDAAHATPADARWQDELDDWRRRLDRRFGNNQERDAG